MESTGWGTTAGGSFRGQAVKWEPGLTVGEFQLVDKIGQGGMGTVWRVVHGTSGAHYAMKTILIEADARALARFEREGQAQAAVDGHPNVVRVRSAGEHQGQRYLVMDLASGGDLKERIREGGSLPPLEAARLVADLCGGLEHVHACGILHRDLKPPNVLFDEAGVPKLVDFGVARLKGQDNLTQTGTMLGTPAYMAPEQVDGIRSEIDERVDVYGAGAILYECLTGQAPFQGSVASVIKAVLEDLPEPPRQRRKEIPIDLETVCLKALAKDRYQRYPSARALREDLERVIRGDPIEGARAGIKPRSVAGAIVLLGILGAGALALTSGGETPPASPTVEPSEHATLSLDPLPPGPSRTSTIQISGAASHATRVRARVGRLGDWLEVDVVERVFTLEIELEPGEQRVYVAALNAEGQPGDEIKLKVVFQALPAWYTQLEGEARPPQPLPAGVDPTAAKGEYLHRKSSSILVYVPPSSFPMGIDTDPEGVGIKREHVQPQHQVTLTQGYFLGKYELSLAQYEAFEADTGHPPHEPWGKSGFEPEGAERWRALKLLPNHPVFGVSWSDAVAFCGWAGLRLPTEAEWNLAAASPKGWVYPWGNALVNLDSESSEQFTPLNLTSRMGKSTTIPGYGNDPYLSLCPVDRYPDARSVCGAEGMLGNVQEWVQDRFGLYPADPVTDPRGPSQGQGRVVRGGDWDNGLGWASTWSRRPYDPRRRDEVTGFRVALSAE